MARNLFYVDSCIYINLWNKEGSARFGTPYWKIAAKFFEKFKENSIFYYSNFILKELKFNIPKKEFAQKLKLFNSSSNFKKLKCSPAKFQLARKIESELRYEISFYDILHLILAKRSDAVLITRDKKLINACHRYEVAVNRPEDLFE